MKATSRVLNHAMEAQKCNLNPKRNPERNPEIPKRTSQPEIWIIYHHIASGYTLNQCTS